jgi:hypothetical protein
VVLRAREKKLPQSSAGEFAASADPIASTAGAPATEPCNDAKLLASGKPFASTLHAPAAEPYDGIDAVGAAAIADIDKLMEELRTARDYVQSEGERVRRANAHYAHLAQTASASVKVTAESLGEWRNRKPVNEGRAAMPRIPASAHDGEPQHEPNDQ